MVSNKIDINPPRTTLSCRQNPLL